MTSEMEILKWCSLTMR